MNIIDFVKDIDLTQLKSHKADIENIGGLFGLQDVEYQEDHDLIEYELMSTTEEFVDECFYNPPEKFYVNKSIMLLYLKNVGCCGILIKDFISLRFNQEHVSYCDVCIFEEVHLALFEYICSIVKHQYVKLTKDSAELSNFIKNLENGSATVVFKHPTLNKL